MINYKINSEKVNWVFLNNILHLCVVIPTRIESASAVLPPNVPGDIIEHLFYQELVAVNLQAVTIKGR
jgi:hypothetical protein